MATTPFRPNRPTREDKAAAEAVLAQMFAYYDPADDAALAEAEDDQPIYDLVA